MRIKRLIVETVECEMPGDLRNARRRWTSKPMLFAFAETREGPIGIGEGWTSYGSARALAATIEDDIAPLVVGRALDDTAGLAVACREACVMSGRYGITAVALSAVEMALWDLRAQRAGQPLWRHLGAGDPRVPVYASAGLYRDGAGPDDLGEELASHVAQGFDAVKMKVGGLPIPDDVARVAAARRAIGPDIALMVDAHYTFSPTDALAFAKAIAPYRVTWLEAPITPTDIAGYAWLCAESPVAICGNETLPWRDSFAALSKAGVRYLMPDLSACGGVQETIAVGDIATAAGTQVTLHASSSVVLQVASLHVAAAMPATHSVEFHMMHRWFQDLAPAGALAVRDGRIVLGDRPGLGLTIAPGDFARMA